MRRAGNAETATSPGQADISQEKLHDSGGLGSSGTAAWSVRFSRLLALGGPLSSSVQAFQERIASYSPTVTGTGDRTAAIPLRLPVIPGVVDLVPKARGGMGIVYRGRDVAIGRTVAVKVMWPFSAGLEGAGERAKREAEALGRISHTNVVAVHTAGDVEGSPFLVMEWVDGPTLHDRVEQGLPSPRQAARLVRDLAAAMAVVHDAGILHRDIKPGNVLLSGPAADDWDRCVPKLADFGLARPTDGAGGITQDATALGTPAYMAPEQTGLADDLGPVGPAGDIHGLGGLLFALVTGTPPYAAAHATTSLHRAARGDISWPPAAQKLPKDLRAIIETCLEREPTRRYSSAALLAEDLQQFVEGLPVRARPVSPLRKLVKRARRMPVVSATLSLAAVVAIIALGSVIYYEATVAAARTRIEQTVQLAESTAGVAARSMGHLTSDLIEKLVRQSQPGETDHIEFLKQVRDEFANWPLGDSPTESLRFRVQGLQRTAHLFAEVSQFDEALACIGLTFATLDEIAAHPGQEAWSSSERLASLHVQRFFLYNLRRFDEAMASARQSIAVLERAPADLPDRNRELVRATLDLGMFLHEERQFDEGSAMIEKALAQMHALRRARPDEFSLVEQEAHALFTAQLCAWNAERFDDCRRWSERLAWEIGSFVARPQAASLTSRQRDFLTKMVCFGLTRLAELADMAGQIDEAIEMTEKRRQLCKDIVSDFPDEASDPVQMELVDAELRRAELLERSGRSAEAEGILSKAATMAVRWHEAEPAVWVHAFLLAKLYQRQAEFAAARGDAIAAAKCFQKVASLMEPWMGNPAHRTEAAELMATVPVLRRPSVASSLQP